MEQETSWLREALLLGGTLLLGMIGIFVRGVRLTIAKMLKQMLRSKKQAADVDEISVAESGQRDRQINELSAELRTTLGADRACVFQFHNGSFFASRNPIYKFSCTHESCRPGITYEAGNMQNINVSTALSLVQTLWGEETTGVLRIKCKTHCPQGRTCPHADKDHGCFWLGVHAMAESSAKSMLIVQNIHYLLVSPLYSASDSRLIGFIGVEYCVPDQQPPQNAFEVCQCASNIASRILEPGKTLP